MYFVQSYFLDAYTNVHVHLIAVIQRPTSCPPGEQDLKRVVSGVFF